MKKNLTKTNCLLQDGSVFIGLTSLPLGDDKEVINTTERIFSKFSTRLNEKINIYSDTEKENIYYKEVNKYFYNPKRYYMFGKYDLAIITLIDGFSFPVREFNYKSFHLYGSEDSTLNMSRHNILGPTPKLSKEDDIESDNYENSAIVKLYDKLHSNGMPLLSISRLKLNDSILFKNGANFLRASILLINNFLKDNFDSKFEFIIIENYGWSEITILFFIDSYNAVANLMIKMRNLNLENLFNTLEILDASLKTSLSNSLKDFSPDTEVFIDSHSIFGFDYDFSKNPKPFKLKINQDDLISHKIEISARPGYIQDTFKKISNLQKNNLKNIKIQATVGKSDIVYYVNNEQKIKTHDLISWIIKFREIKENTSNINNLKTSIILNHTVCQFKEKQNSNKPSALSKKNISKLIFNSKTLSDLNNSLSKLNTPHVIKEAILNLYSIFNNKISSQLSFASFIELRPFLTYLLAVVSSSEKEYLTNSNYNPKSLLKSLDPGMHAFHHAYYNRVLGQYKNGDQYDQPMFFDIGSQSLISAFDILYKNITSVIGNDASFVFVESDPHFTISDFALRLNYFHLFNPELLCAVLFQEATNQCASKFKNISPSLFRFHRNSENDISTKKIDLRLDENGLETDRLRLDYRNVIEPLTPELFEHIFSDIVGYRLFYQNDADMYLYWSWGYFSTHSDHFIKNKDRKLKADSKSLVPYILRQLIVLKCFEPDKYKNYNIIFDEEIDNLIYQKTELVKSFLDTFFWKGEFLNWIDEIKLFAESLLKSIQSNEINNQETVDKIKTKLINGAVINHNVKNNNYNETFQFTRNLLFAYLKAVDEVTGSKKKSKNIVDRGYLEENELSKKERNSEKKKFSDLLFDPQGGTYIVKPSIRRKMYQLRSTFHMSLIHMSLIEKGKMIERIINSEDLI